MSALLKKLLFVSVLLPLALNSVSDCSAKGKTGGAKVSSRRAGVPPAYRGLPKWVQYDHGGMYYYQKRELEKARQYWLVSLKEAEAVVPAERAKGLSIKTEQDCCNLLQHLMMMVTDSQLNPDNSAKDAAGGGSIDSLRRQYDLLALQLKKVREDGRWLDRVEVFANRAIGKGNPCMDSLDVVRGQMNIKILNTNYTMSLMENQMKLTQSSIDPRGVTRNPNGSPNGTGLTNGLAPNGEYIPAGNVPTGNIPSGTAP